MTARDDLGGSRDVVLGGDQRDWVFAGLADGVVNGQDGDDLVFGGDGSDALWGGLGNDRVFAGFGNDLVDVKPTASGAWPISWWKGGPLVGSTGWTALLAAADTDLLRATDNGYDVVFGGDGQDALQADVGDAGPVPGDRLLDWYDGHNVYFVCDGAYGAGYVLRNSSPSAVDALQRIGRADGAAGAEGTRQLAIPVSGNRSPVHPAHPGNNSGC